MLPIKRLHIPRHFMSELRDILSNLKEKQFTCVFGLVLGFLFVSFVFLSLWFLLGGLEVSGTALPVSEKFTLQDTVNSKAAFTKLTPGFILDRGCLYANKNLNDDDREMWQLCFHREAAVLPHEAWTN